MPFLAPVSSPTSQVVVHAYFQDGLTQETTPDITLTVLTPFKHADRLEHLDLSAQSLTHNEPLLQQRWQQALAWLVIYPALREITLHPDDGILNAAIQALFKERRLLTIALHLMSNPDLTLGLKSTWWSYCLPVLCDANRPVAANALLNALWHKPSSEQLDLSDLDEAKPHYTNTSKVAPWKRLPANGLIPH